MGMALLHVLAMDVLLFFLLLPSSNGFDGLIMRSVKGHGGVLDIGVILDFDSLAGKEAWVAMEIASQTFNAKHRGYKLCLHRENSGGKPLEAIFSAKRLIEKKQVKAIIGLETWNVANLVSELGIQVPIVSLARNRMGTVIPGLVQMGNDNSEMIRSMVDIVWTYNRNRVSIIYEDLCDDEYSMSLYLSKELHHIGSEIEDQLVLPPYSSLSDPESLVKQKLRILEQKISPVIIVLDLSLQMASHLFKEATRIGLFKGDSIWILSESVLNILDSVDLNVTSAMKGTIGISTDVPRKSEQYLDFSRKFGKKWSHRTRVFSPGFHAFLAYDSVTLVTNAVNGISGDVEISKEHLVNRILQSKFNGLSGQVMFKDGQISTPRKLSVKSISEEKSREELNIKAVGNALAKRNKGESCDTVSLECSVAQLNDPMVMKIGVPHKTPLDKFVKEDTSSSPGKFTGFCIQVFDSILKRLDTCFEPYCMVPHNGSYDELVQMVHNKTFFAAVGDITILGDRSKNVSFTQPFIESTLSMILLAEPENKTWILLKPFTDLMWITVGFQLIVIMLTVWCLESPTNEAFQGSRTDQMSAAMWFTLSALFFAHREELHRKLTRIITVVWFFEALVLTQSYAANLTSMLTVQKLKQNEITVDWLLQKNALVGCDNFTFLCESLKLVQRFPERNTVGITEYTDIQKMLSNKSIEAMFVEYPYAKAFMSRYCTGFTVTHLPYRYGGFGFAFQKHTEWTDKFSEAILELSQNGELQNMTDWAFRDECSEANADATASLDSDTQRLGVESFWALFAFSIVISILCVLLSIIFPRGIKMTDEGQPTDQVDERPNESPEHVQDREHEMLTVHGRMTPIHS